MHERFSLTTAASSAWRPVLGAVIHNRTASVMAQLLPPPSERFFEDYTVGTTYLCGSFALAEGEIIEFATRYDPQEMHIDRAWAADGPFGGIIASGWHTITRMMRLLVENYLPAHGLAAAGVDELRWLRPVRPDMTLTVYATVQDARRSRTRPDRGLVHTLVEVKDQDGEAVLTMKPMNFMRTRMPA